MTTALNAAWRSARHVGANKPTQVVRLQKGYVQHDYSGEGLPEPLNFGYIVGSKHNGRPWHAYWKPTGPWLDVPNVMQCDLDAALSANGITTCTLRIENIVAKEWAGLVGIFHLIKRGYMSPSFGWQMAGRLKSPEQPNEWLDVFNGGYRVYIEQGYGENLVPAFTGLIDDVDIQVSPDTLTLTVRDFGQLFTDQNVVGWNKAREIRPPVIFADRYHAQKLTPISAGADASSQTAGHSARNVTKKGDDDWWQSEGRNQSDAVEWVEIHLPAGTYDDAFLWPRYSGMECWISVYARGAHIDQVPVANGWVDRGLGNVPRGSGVSDDIPFVAHLPATTDKGKLVKLGFSLTCNENTTIRYSFSNLPLLKSTGDHRAAVNRVVSNRERPNWDAQKGQWVLVDDPSDVVRWCCMWCGFSEWEIEDFGMHINNNTDQGTVGWPFHVTDHFIEIINYVKSQGDFVFFMKPPTGPDSIGVPVFRHARSVENPKVRYERARGRGILTNIQPKWSKDALSYVIWVRGDLTDKAHGGVALAEESELRYQAIYWPPWSGAHHSVAQDYIIAKADEGRRPPLALTGAGDADLFTDRMAGLRRHALPASDHNLTSHNQCLMAAILLAIQEYLASWTGTVEVPGYPLFHIDDHIDVQDDASGINSRLWINQWHSTFVAGDQGSFKLSLSGSFMDMPDMVALRNDYLTVRNRVNAERL